MEHVTLKQLLGMLSLGKLALAVALLLATWLLLSLLHFALDRLVVRFPRYRLQLKRVYPVLRIVGWAGVTAFIGARVLAPPESVAFAILGSIGLGVGLAAQDAIRNMVAGVIIMFNPPYRVGDMVTLAGHSGEVVKLEWGVTWLKTFDDNTVMVPNGQVLTNPVVNANSGALDEMVVVSLDIPVEADHALAISLGRECVTCSPYAFLKKPILVNLSSRGEYGCFLARVTIKAYVVDVRLERRFASDIVRRVLDAYKGVGIYPVANHIGGGNLGSGSGIEDACRAG